MTTASIDQDRLMALVGQGVSDMGALLNGNLIVLGDKLGLYRAIQQAGALTPGQLAEATGTNERYCREWLNTQAASGYVTYNNAGTYSLTAEQAEALTNDDSPFCILGGFQLVSAASRALPELIERFRSGAGLGWHEHHSDVFEGTERFFRPGYAANLVNSWLPALDGVIEKLTAGADVGDVGCGHGASTIVMAKAFPKSRFTGFDYHAASVDAARRAAKAAGVTNAAFEVASAKDYPGRYDLVCHFDCLHDMGDPVGAARHVRESLNPGGNWMVVEPFAQDEVTGNLNPVGRVFYAASTFICTPASMSQEVGLALGAQAGEARLISVIREGGFDQVRTAAATPFNLVIEAKA